MNNRDLVVKITSRNRITLFVNTEGFTYARYVGIAI